MRSRSPLQFFAFLPTAFVLSTCLGGCAWLSALQETEPEPEFSAWSKGLTGARPADGKATSATVKPKSKSLFFNERSREVEKSIGYEP